MVTSAFEEVPDIKHPHSLILVDDIPETGKFFAEQLRPFFQNVTVTTPDRAENIVSRGNFSAMVTDLRFVGNRIDNGLELARSLNGHCPPTILLTASVSGKTLALITSQAIHTDGTPLLRGAMKGGGIDRLIAQILWAISDAERIPQEARTKALKKVMIPKFNKGDAPAELSNLIALLSERLKNYVRITRERLSILKEKHGLEDWPSWKAIKATVEWQLEQFATFNSERLIGKGEKDTLDALHELNSRIILLDMDRLQIPESEKNEEVMGTIQELKNAHAEIATEIRWDFKKAENICNPNFDFDRDVEKILSRWQNKFEIWYPRISMEWKTRFRDTGRLVTDFFSALQKQFDHKSCKIDIRAINESDPWWDGSEGQKKLQKKIDWGGWYEIFIRINHYGDTSNKFFGKSYEHVLDPIRSILEQLIAAKRIFIKPETFSYTIDENGGDIRIILKTQEIDRIALAKKEAEEAKIQVSKIGTMNVSKNREEVYRVTTPVGELTMIGCSMPKKMKNMGGNWCVILHEGELILSSARAHFENDMAICHYLVKRKNLSSRDAFNIAQGSIRLQLQDGYFLADHEQVPGEELPGAQKIWKQMWYEGRYENQEEAIARLESTAKELWIQGVVLDRHSFLGRSGLMYMMVSDLDDPELQKFREEEWEEKDEWFDVEK